MTEWREEKLENIFCIVKEVFKPSNEQQFKYIGLEHIEQGSLRLNGWGYSNSVQSNKYFYKKDDVLFGKLRPYFRKIIKAPFDGVCSTDIWVCRAKNNFDQNFLFYFLANQEFVDTANSTDEGTRMPRADWNFLKKTIWNIPPLPEQKAIAEVLSSLDDKIDLLTRQNKTLEDLAQAYFRKWFIEDIHNKICYKRFADVAEFSKGKKPREIIEEQRKGYVRQILIDTFDTDKEYYTRPEGMIISTETDILMVMDGASSGRVEIGFSGVVGSTIGMFRPKSDFKYPMFLYEFLKSNEEFIMDNTTGSAIPHADKKLIFELEIPYFQEEKIQEFENFALVLFNKRQNNRRQIRTLTKLRDTLLPKLISGEIRVKM